MLLFNCCNSQEVSSTFTENFFNEAQMSAWITTIFRTVISLSSYRFPIWLALVYNVQPCALQGRPSASQTFFYLSYSRSRLCWSSAAYDTKEKLLMLLTQFHSCASRLSLPRVDNQHQLALSGAKELSQKIRHLAVFLV